MAKYLTYYRLDYLTLRHLLHIPLIRKMINYLKVNTLRNRIDIWMK